MVSRRFFFVFAYGSVYVGNGDNGVEGEAESKCGC